MTPRRSRSSRTAARRSAAVSRSSAACSRPHGVTDPLWREVPKSRYAPKQVEKALKLKADLIFVWGGDGMVQRSHRRRRRLEDDARDPARRHREPAGVEPRHPEGSRAGGRDRPLGVARADRRRPHQRRALRGDGGRGLRRAHDRRRRRHPQGPLRPARLHLDGREAPARQAVQGEDRRRRRALVRRRGELHPARQRRQALRQRRGLRGRAARRRHPRARRRLGRRDAAVGADDRARGRRAPRRTRRRRTRPRCTRCASSSTRRCRTSSTAATARRCASCGSTSSPAPSRSACRCPSADGPT